MRLVLAGIMGLVAGLAVGSVLLSGGRHEIEETHSRSDPPASLRQRASFDERFSFNERFSFDERFLFDQPSDSFEQRFATAAVSFEPRFVIAAVSPAAAPAVTTDTEEDTNSVPS